MNKETIAATEEFLTHFSTATGSGTGNLKLEFLGEPRTFTIRVAVVNDGVPAEWIGIGSTLLEAMKALLEAGRQSRGRSGQ